MVLPDPRLGSSGTAAEAGVTDSVAASDDAALAAVKTPELPAAATSSDSADTPAELADAIRAESANDSSELLTAEGAEDRLSPAIKDSLRERFNGRISGVRKLDAKDRIF
ncbi:MAG: hypothetical protein ACPGTR_01715 [Opitutales bacterium]